ncbi:S49 family peptidase [Rhodopirellula halodulae]|uniref:S49 family peptidase n=1 Tax=Rhodopirellula halodulae TaxID=2894198 RepID=UPI001E3C645D|nr:S49 family peptidase [Rhodopirellula sp. JC737]MCC9655291.1 S49 family peptidase [Rhodopirellula sp. JC737]
MSDNFKTTEFTRKDLAGIPHLDQYAGIWLCEEATFSLLLSRIQSLDIAAHMASEVVAKTRSMGLDDAQSLIEVSGSTGILNLDGVLMKHASSVTGGTSTVLARRALKTLVTDDDIKSIVLKIESPGGTASGTQQLADDIASAAKRKRLVAHIEDLGASAAYWLASQAPEIRANSPAKVGSIGAYMVVTDSSGLAAKEGVKVHVVRAGEFKGMGIPGTEISTQQLEELQRQIEGTNSFFLDAVARGRGLSADAVKGLADGRTHFAAAAKDLGLIDGVQSFEETLAEVQGQNSFSTNRSRRMASENATASVADIKANCPGISSDKVLEFAEAGKTLDQCKNAWLQELATENAALSEANAELAKKLSDAEAKAEAAEAAATDSTLGVDPLEDSPRTSSASGSATEQFNALVSEKVAQGMTRGKATATVVRQDPNLHKAMLEEVNG